MNTYVLFLLMCVWNITDEGVNSVESPEKVSAKNASGILTTAFFSFWMNTSVIFD